MKSSASSIIEFEIHSYLIYVRSTLSFISSIAYDRFDISYCYLIFDFRYDVYSFFRIPIFSRHRNGDRKIIDPRTAMKHTFGFIAALLPYRLERINSEYDRILVYFSSQ